MTLDELREYCLSLPGAEESQPFGPDTLVFKVKQKVFLITQFDTSPLQFNVKCDPDQAVQLREQYESVLPGYHMNKKHWNTIIIDGSVSIRLVHTWIEDSYHLVKKTKKF